MDENRLGAILLEGGIVDEAGLERCLAIQSLTGGNRPIGRILVEQGLLPEQELKRLLALQTDRWQDGEPEHRPNDLASASLLTAAKGNGAGEIMVSEGRPVRMRIADGWRDLTDDMVSGPEVWDLVRETMGHDVLEQLADRYFVQRPWRIDGVGAGMATAFRQFQGVAVRITMTPERVMTPAELGVPDAVVDLVGQGKGLVLCVGERGNTRSELLTSLTHLVSRDESQYVVLVDDQPMELPTDGALVVQRRFGIDPAARADSLRSVLREDPDALVIADVGTPEAFELALRGAEGGRLVIAYLDARNVVSAMARVLNFYPTYDLPRVRSSLAAVLRSVLVRHQLPNAEHTGTVAATELLVVDDAARDVIRDGELRDLGLLLRTENGVAGHSLDQSILDLLTAGQVRLEDVFSRAEEKAWLLERTRQEQGEEN